MTSPTIHMNGTIADDLLEYYMEAASSIREAAEKVAKNGPNARDYYVQAGPAFTLARTEHEQRIWRLREVLAEIEEIMQNIVTQQEERDARKRHAL